jgi:hypothetical protein
MHKKKNESSIGIGPVALVGRINRTLAPAGKAVRKTPEGDYCLVDSTTGKTRYLTLSKLETLARNLGVPGLSKA